MIKIKITTIYFNFPSKKYFPNKKNNSIFDILINKLKKYNTVTNDNPEHKKHKHTKQHCHIILPPSLLQLYEAYVYQM